MDEQNTYKINITSPAYKIAEIYCSSKGIPIEDYVSDLILQNIGKMKLIEVIDEKSTSSAIRNCGNKKYTNLDNFPESSNLSTFQLNRFNFALGSEGDKQLKAGSAACRIIDSLSNEPINAKTPEEIARSLQGISVSAIQRGLYWLIKRTMVNRRLREDPNDKRKNSWEYWKLEPTIAFIEKGIDLTKLLESIPSTMDQAVSIRDIAVKLNQSPSTIRDALKRLEQKGQIVSLQGKNHRNQTTIKYYNPLL